MEQRMKEWMDGWMDDLVWNEVCAQVGFESSLSDSSF